MTDLENIYDEVFEESSNNQILYRVKKLINDAKSKFDSYTPLKQKAIIVGIATLLMLLISKIIKNIKNDQKSNRNRRLDEEQIEKCHQLRARVLKLIKVNAEKNSSPNEDTVKKYNTILDELKKIYTELLDYQDYLTSTELDNYSKKIDSMEKKING